MRKMKSLVFSLILLLVLAMMISTVAIGPATAKNLNLPVGADLVEYYNAGGQVDIALPTSLPSGYPSTTTAIEFRFVHVEDPNSGVSFDSLIVFLYAIQLGATARSWIPIAIFTTSADAAAQGESFWSGSPIKLDASLYKGPPLNIPQSLWAAFSTNNVKVVSEDVLKVERHGNDVSVNLNASQAIKRSFSTTTFTLPAFSLELKNYGGSVHHNAAISMTGWPGASGITMVFDEMGFKATGTFSTSSDFNGAQVQNATIWMHGSHTFYPPV